MKINLNVYTRECKFNIKNLINILRVTRYNGLGEFCYSKSNYKWVGYYLIVKRCVFVCIRLARDGYLIYCYGDCNRRYEEALAAARAAQKVSQAHIGRKKSPSPSGDDMAKMIWLQMYNNKRFMNQIKKNVITKIDEEN